MTARRTGAVFDTLMNVSPAISDRLMASRAARLWSLGNDDHEWFLGHKLERQVSYVWFGAQECQVELAAHEGSSQVRGVPAGNRNLYIGQFIEKDAHGFREPVHLFPSQEAEGKGLFLRLGGPPGRFTSRVNLRQCQPCMIEKRAARRSQLDNTRATGQQIDAELVLQIPDLPTE